MNRLLGRLERLLPRGSFARSVGILASGTVVGQGVAVLASPVLTRLYSPESFGLFSTFAAVLSILVALSSLRYEMAIPLPESDDDAVGVLALSLVLVLITGLVTAMVLVLLQFSGSPAGAAGGPGWSHWWYLPIGVVLAGGYQAVNYWAVRKGMFGAISRTKMERGVVSTLGQVLLGLLQGGAGGLVVGHVLGQGSGTLTLVSRSLRQPGGPRRPSPLDLLRLAARFRRFPLFSSWSSVANALSVQLPILLLGLFFSPAVVGLYALGVRVLQTPMSLIGSAIGQVFFGRAADARRSGLLAELSLSTYRTLVQFGVPVIAFIGAAAPLLFGWLFGAEWAAAGHYAQWLTPWLCLVFVGSPLSTLPAIMERQGASLAFDASLLTARALALVAGGLSGSVVLTIGLFSAVSVVCWGVYLLWMLALSGNRPAVALGVLAREAAMALAAVAPVLAAQAFLGAEGGAWLLAGLGLSGALTLARLLHLARVRRRESDAPGPSSSA